MTKPKKADEELKKIIDDLWIAKIDDCQICKGKKILRRKICKNCDGTGKVVVRPPKKPGDDSGIIDL